MVCVRDVMIIITLLLSLLSSLSSLSSSLLPRKYYYHYYHRNCYYDYPHYYDDVYHYYYIIIITLSSLLLSSSGPASEGAPSAVARQPRRYLLYPIISYCIMLYRSLFYHVIVYRVIVYSVRAPQGLGRGLADAHATPQVLHTCHNLPPSEIDGGLFLAVFTGTEGRYLFHRIGWKGRIWQLCPRPPPARRGSGRSGRAARDLAAQGYMYIRICEFIYIYIYMHMYVCICMYVCMYICIYIYIYMYIYIYTHNLVTLQRVIEFEAAVDTFGRLLNETTRHTTKHGTNFLNM